MSEATSYQASSGRLLSYWKLITMWTVSLLAASVLTTLFTPELAEMFHPVSRSLSTITGVIIAFCAPPIITIWGVGIVLFAYKYRMLCAVPTVTLVTSFVLSALFGFPLSTLFAIGTTIVMVYSLRWNRPRTPRE